MTEEQQPAREEANEQALESLEEEYLSWKKNSPLLYDTLVSHLLEWPSRSCQYFDAFEESKAEGVLVQSFAVGTFADESGQNQLMVMSSRIPVFGAEGSGQFRGFDSQKQGSFKCVRREKQFPHSGEINKLGICPSQQSIVATKSENGRVYLFRVDGPKQGLVATLADGQSGGFGLDWNCVDNTKLLASDSKGSIGLFCFEQSFEVRAEHSEDPVPVSKQPDNPAKSKGEHPPLPGVTSRSFENNNMAVNDCRFQKVHGSIFGAVSDDCSVTLWDVRTKGCPFVRVLAHINEIFCLDFSPHSEFMLLTGAGDNLVKLWDIRKFTKPVHEFESHGDKVLAVKWSPNNEALFASSGEDRTVRLWDCSRIGNDVSNEEQLDGPPELLFTHKGHKGIVEDACWNPHQEFCLMSVDSENILQIWEIDDKIYFDE